MTFANALTRDARFESLRNRCTALGWKALKSRTLSVRVLHRSLSAQKRTVRQEDQGYYAPLAGPADVEGAEEVTAQAEHLEVAAADAPYADGPDDRKPPSDTPQAHQ